MQETRVQSLGWEDPYVGEHVVEQVMEQLHPCTTTIDPVP